MISQFKNSFKKIIPQNISTSLTLNFHHWNVIRPALHCGCLWAERLKDVDGYEITFPFLFALHSPKHWDGAPPLQAPPTPTPCSAHTHRHTTIPLRLQPCTHPSVCKAKYARTLRPVNAPSLFCNYIDSHPLFPARITLTVSALVKFTPRCHGQGRTDQ